MKKILFALALVAAAAQVACAQSIKSAEDVNKALQKAEADAANPKKADKYATWLKLGQEYVKAYDNPIVDVIGDTKEALAIPMYYDKALSSEFVEVAGTPMEKVTYEHKNLYFDGNGFLQIVEVTKPSYEGDALGRAAEAYAKAHELDAKGQKTKDIGDALHAIDQKYYQLAYYTYILGNPDKASDLFAKAAKVSRTAPCPVVDSVAVYYAGLTAKEAGNPAKAFNDFNDALSLGFKEKGSVYANLADCALAAADTLAARKYLEEGFAEFPENAQVMSGLINLYLAIKEDPNHLIVLLDAAKEQMPDNPSLYNVEGDIRVKLGDYDGAVAAFRKAGEVDPSYEMGWYSEGAMWYNRAVQISEEASALPYSAYREYDKKMEELNATIHKCIEPFEKCYGMTSRDDVKASVADFLKRVYFQLRNENPEYMAAYEKYNAIVAGN